MGNFNDPNQRFGLNRIKPPRQNEENSNFDVRTRLRTKSTTASTSVVTTSSPRNRAEKTTSMSPELQEMHDHIMDMNAHDLRDAIMDPMMLGNFAYYGYFDN